MSEQTFNSSGNFEIDVNVKSLVIGASSDATCKTIDTSSQNDASTAVADTDDANDTSISLFPENSSMTQKVCIVLFKIIYLPLICAYYVLCFAVGSDIGRDGLHPKLPPALSLFCATFTAVLPLVLFMACFYHSFPNNSQRQTTLIRALLAILGMTGALIAAYFAAFWHIMGYLLGLYPLINMCLHPLILVLGIPLSFLSCLMFTCHRKTLIVQKLPLDSFYKLQNVASLANIILFLDLFYMIQNVKVGLVAIFDLLIFLRSLVYFFTKNIQEILCVGDLGVFIKITFWQATYISSCMMVIVNVLVNIGISPGPGIFLTLFLSAILVYIIFGVCVIVVDWLIRNCADSKIVKMMIPAAFDAKDGNTDGDLESNNSIDNTNTENKICNLK